MSIEFKTKVVVSIDYSGHGAICDVGAAVKVQHYDFWWMDRSVLYFDCMNVNILTVVLYYSCVRHH